MKLETYDKTQSIDFFLPEKFKKIGLNVSGGLDSAFLLWLIVKFLKDNNRTDTEIVAVTIGQNDWGKRHWNSIVSAKVIDKVLRMHDPNVNNGHLNGKQSIVSTHFTYYRTSQDKTQANSMEPRLFNNRLIDIIMSGKTANPPGDIDELLDGRDITRDLGNRGDDQILYGKTYGITKSAYYTPFVNVDKRFIADQYKKFNLMNDLFPVTRSCERVGEPEGKIFTTEEDFFANSCKAEECWWCKERYWAFGRY
tara:strand:+ start:3134 stop:3889 length:756 start_codon:yes stop_codon:yes gene_type:complete